MPIYRNVNINDYFKGMSVYAQFCNIVICLAKNGKIKDGILWVDELYTEQTNQPPNGVLVVYNILLCPIYQQILVRFFDISRTLVWYGTH